MVPANSSSSRPAIQTATDSQDRRLTSARRNKPNEQGGGMWRRVPPVLGDKASLALLFLASD